MLGVPVIRPKVAETTALGAAYAAGLATGFWAERRTCARTGSRTSAGSPRWTREQRDEYSSTGRRPSRGPSTGSSSRERARAGRGGRSGAPPAVRDCTRHDHAADRRPRHRRRRHRRRASPGTPRCAASTSSWSTAATSAEGTSGRFHGLLHSGGRYAVKDPIAATRVRGGERDRPPHRRRRDRGHRRPVRHDARRRPRLRRPVPRGLRARPACPAEEIAVAEALRREPRLNPGIKRAFAVPDASIDVWKLRVGAAPAARQEHGARVLPYHRVRRARTATATRVTGARAARRAHRRGRSRSQARVHVNAAGAWAGQIAEHGRHRGRPRHARQGDHDRDEPPAGEHGGQPLHRCPRDGDIIVPIRTVSVIGTTDIRADRPGRARGHRRTRSTRCSTTASGSCPASATRARCACGPACGRCSRTRRRRRPDDRATSAARTRAARPPRARRRRRLPHDHRRQAHDVPADGRGDASTRCARSSATTARARRTTTRCRARRTARLPARHAPARPGAELRTSSSSASASWSRARALEAGDARRAAPRTSTTSAAALRLGMGPCQGGFCIYRATGILHSLERLDGARGQRALARLPRRSAGRAC